MKYKTIVINLVNGKKRRIKKKEIVDIQEQYTIEGKIDIAIIMESGKKYIINMTKEQVKTKINNQEKNK